MKYGQIAGSKKVNYAIYRCFEHLCDKDQQRFVKKFREQPHDSDQIMHTFRELILGAYLSSRGFRVRHEYMVESKTPDWCILDNRSAVVGIVELANFHIDAVTESEMSKQMQTKGIAVYWRDANKNNVERLYYCIWDKMQEYQVLIEKLNVPYIIAICPDSKAATDFEEVLPCLHHNEFGLFQMYQDTSGILYFEENAGQYLFRYEQNPNALRKFDLPGGVLSLVAEQER
ncbi:MAG: hypothetical protein WBE46_04015 [Dehalococcoidia bacterium]